MKITSVDVDMGPAPRTPLRREVKDHENMYEKDGFPKTVKKDRTGKNIPPEKQRDNGICMESCSTPLMNASEIKLIAWGSESFILWLEARLLLFLEAVSSEETP